MIAEADPEFVRTCRTEYLTGALEKLTLEKERFVSLYEDSTKRDLASINRLYFGDKVLKISSEIDKLQRQISALRHPEHKGQIAEEMIQRAKECPFTEIVEFRRNTATCPFHADKTPSMHLYEKDNRTHCFSCHRSFDTIGFMMERDGLTFVEAVKYLA
jgi:hypothetical protein